MNDDHANKSVPKIEQKPISTHSLKISLSFRRLCRRCPSREMLKLPSDEEFGRHTVEADVDVQYPQKGLFIRKLTKESRKTKL